MERGVGINEAEWTGKIEIVRGEIYGSKYSTAAISGSTPGSLERPFDSSRFFAVLRDLNFSTQLWGWISEWKTGLKKKRGGG